MKVLNVAEVAMASGGDQEESNYYPRVTLDSTVGYVDYTGLYDIFASLNQRPDFWGIFFASC